MTRMDCGDLCYAVDDYLESTLFDLSGTEVGMDEFSGRSQTATVVDCPSFFEQLGAARGPHRPGPESDLVDWFIYSQPFCIPFGCRATVFREPRLMSGFPDIVLVFWSESTARDWACARSSISADELRVLHFLVQHGRGTTEELHRLFKKDIDAKLARLASADLIREDGRFWAPRPLTQCFAVREIIAIEAKVSNWHVALEQAFLNTWFASQSFVLVPSVPRGDKLLTQAMEMNLGVWTRSDGQRILPESNSSQLPISYASWLFNEWAWRAELEINSKR